MESLMDEYLAHGVIGGAVFAITILLTIKSLLYKVKQDTIQREAYRADTVILHHQLGRGPHAPSLSPFTLKLETYLRMAKIPYQNNYHLGMYPNGNTNRITYNEENIADSCVDYLNERLGKDLNGHLSVEEQAIARAFQSMVEENLYWSICALTLGDDCTTLRRLFAAGQVSTLWYTLKVLHQTAKNRIRGLHISRRSISETVNMGLADLRALSIYMGSRSFLMGEEPCEMDCAVFGMLAQIKWHLPGSQLETMMSEEFTNLSDYCDRMKDRFWPDWDECNTAGGTKEATK